MIYIRQRIIDFATRFFVWSATLSTLFALIAGLIIFFGLRVEVPNETLRNHVLETQQNHHAETDRLTALEDRMEALERSNRRQAYLLQQLVNRQ